MKIEEIVAIEKAELLKDIANKHKDNLNRKVFFSDLNEVWKEYRVAKYGKLAFLHKWVFQNSLLFEVFFHTTVCEYPDYWFNKKWEIETEYGKFTVRNKEVSIRLKID